MVMTDRTDNTPDEAITVAIVYNTHPMSCSNSSFPCDSLEVIPALLGAEPGGVGTCGGGAGAEGADETLDGPDTVLPSKDSKAFCLSCAWLLGPDIDEEMEPAFTEAGVAWPEFVSCGPA